mmetsp:Transcript_28545/g.78373  ORF Transcript_28545/g.78373 Transcript_28545/m.78373 type:complete len:201 (+) Transcript_28545:74-676(+)
MPNEPGLSLRPLGLQHQTQATLWLRRAAPSTGTCALPPARLAISICGHRPMRGLQLGVLLGETQPACSGRGCAGSASGNVGKGFLELPVVFLVKEPCELCQHDLLFGAVLVYGLHDLGKLLLKLAHVVVQDFVLVSEVLLSQLTLYLQVLVVLLVGLVLQHLEHLICMPVELLQGLLLPPCFVLHAHVLHLARAEHIRDD